jgi:transcriptional regulator with XRE-family HTH domain
MGRKRTGPSRNAPERNRQFAEHLSALMQSAGLTAPELASRMGRSRSEVYQYLVGQHLPRLECLPELARALNLDTARSLLPDGW